MNSRTIMCICVLALLVTAGCVRTEPGLYVEVHLSGDMVATNDEFRMNGDIVAGGGESKRDVYRNVTLYLLTQDGDVILERNAGNLRGRLPVNVTSSTIPYYVVFDSDDFWKEPNVQVKYYRLINDDGERYYRVTGITNRSELPL